MKKEVSWGKVDLINSMESPEELRKNYLPKIEELNTFLKKHQKLINLKSINFFVVRKN